MATMAEQIVNPLRCFNCGGAHNRIGEVRRCYGRFVTRGIDFTSLDGPTPLDRVHERLLPASHAPDTLGGMTNEQLGTLIGVTFSMASRLRSGDRLPGTDTMEKVRDKLGISLDRQFAARSKGGTAYADLLNETIGQLMAVAEPEAAVGDPV